MPNWSTKKRIMRHFKIGEISGVTRPAQGGALKTFIKFDVDEDDDVLAFAKVSFGQALDQRMIDQKFHRAFYDAFDGIYQRNEAFCEALKDGYASSEDTVRQYVDSVAELARAAAEATAGLAKSANPDAAIEKALSGAVDQFLEQHMEQNIMAITTKALLKAAVAKFAKDGGTDAFITEIKTAAKSLNAEDELPTEGALAIAKSVTDPAVAALQKTVAVLTLSPELKKHYDTLPATEQDAFLALDDAAKAAAIEKGDDPVLYTTGDGVAIRKSDGVGMLMMAKNMDKQAKVIENLLTKNADQDFAAVAKADYGNLPADGVIEFLKMADKMDPKDEDKKKKMFAAMQAANKAAGKNFETIGGGNRTVVKSEDAGAEGQLNEMAKAYAEEHSVSFTKAYDAILSTPEGADLYAEYLAE